VNEEALAHWGLSRQKKTKTKENKHKEASTEVKEWEAQRKCMMTSANKLFFNLFNFPSFVPSQTLLFNTNRTHNCHVYVYIQGVSGGILNILGGGSMDYSE
jgi:hypothetical protein